MPRILVTADAHFGHRNILTYTSRPFPTTQEMDDTLLGNISSMIQGETILYFLGDIAMNPIFIRSFLERVKCQVLFIAGNHDKKRHLWLLSEAENVTYLGKYHEETLGGKKITFCHYPMQQWDGSRHGYGINLHGHSHGNLPPLKGRLDVGVDNAFKLLGEYRPFTLGEAIKFAGNAG